MAECKICGKSFDSIDKRKKYCSEKCVVLGRKLRKKESAARCKRKIIYPPKKCEICGNYIDMEILIKTKNLVKFCSDECRCEMRKKNNKEIRYKKNAEKLGIDYEEYLVHVEERNAFTHEADEIKKAEAEMLEEQKRRAERRKATKKAKKTADQEDFEARQMGLSHGQYQALKMQGQLEAYKKYMQSQPIVKHRYTSHIGCS